MSKRKIRELTTGVHAFPRMDTKLPVFSVGVNSNPGKRGIDDPLVE